jgi:hypothetical protein
MSRFILLNLVISSVLAVGRGKDFAFIDLQPKANQKLDENFHNDQFAGNNLAQLPKGELVLDEVAYKIDGKLVQLTCKYIENKPEKVEDIKAELKLAKLYILHATGFGAFGKPGEPLFIEDGTTIGHYTVKYEDKSEEIIPIVYGEDVRDWFNHDESKPVSRGKVVWEGENDFARQFGVKLRLFRTEWKNPKPNLTVVGINYEREGDSVAAPFCLAITAQR